MSAAVYIYIYHHTPSGQSRLYRVTQLRTDGVHCRESVVSKHNHCCTAAVHIVDPSFPPDLSLCKRRKFSVHGTISYVVFQNIPVVITAVHIKTSMLLEEITGMVYIGNHKIRFGRVLHRPRDSTK